MEIIWPSWFNRPLIMRYVEVEFNLIISTKILSISALEFV
jgi:hypothetical protein